MSRFYSPQECRRKADQEWELAGRARQDRDSKDEAAHTEKARQWDQRAKDGGWEAKA